jgi:hypothetical protein
VRLDYNAYVAAKKETEKDPAAQALAGKRWSKTAAKDRIAIAPGLAEARWAGHVAKKPASSRKTSEKSQAPK